MFAVIQSLNFLSNPQSLHQHGRYSAHVEWMNLYFYSKSYKFKKAPRLGQGHKEAKQPGLDDREGRGLWLGPEACKFKLLTRICGSCPQTFSVQPLYTILVSYLGSTWSGRQRTLWALSYLEIKTCTRDPVRRSSCTDPPSFLASLFISLTLTSPRSQASNKVLMC